MRDKWDKLLDRFEHGCREFKEHTLHVLSPTEVEIVFPDGSSLGLYWRNNDWTMYETLSGPGGEGRTDMPYGMGGGTD